MMDVQLQKPSGPALFTKHGVLASATIIEFFFKEYAMCCLAVVNGQCFKYLDNVDVDFCS